MGIKKKIEKELENQQKKYEIDSNNNLQKELQLIEERKNQEKNEHDKCMKKLDIDKELNIKNLDIQANERIQKMDIEKKDMDRKFELDKQKFELEKQKFELEKIKIDNQFKFQMGMLNMQFQYNQYYQMNQNNQSEKQSEKNNNNQNMPFMLPIFRMPMMGMYMNQNDHMPMMNMNNLNGFPMMNMANEIKK